MDRTKKGSTAETPEGLMRKANVKVEVWSAIRGPLGYIASVGSRERGEGCMYNIFLDFVHQCVVII